MSRVAIACYQYQQVGFTPYTKASRGTAFRLYARMASSGGTLRYKLTDASTLVLDQGDLTKYQGDAIVNAGTCRNIDHRLQDLSVGSYISVACMCTSKVTDVEKVSAMQRMTDFWGVVEWMGVSHKPVWTWKPLQANAWELVSM